MTALSSPAAPECAASRPNIVFILSDDHAAQAISCYGSKVGRTPNIDRLAAGGMRFDRCFCHESICSPSRAAIMTGKYGHITGAKGWEPYDRRHRSFPEYLQAAGYQTVLVGKYHLGVNPPGFDYYDILPGQGRYQNPVLVSKSGKQVRQGHVSDVITDLALTWLKQRDPQRPFLLCLHHKATHMDWQPASRHQKLFEDQTIPEPPTLFDDHRERANCVTNSILTIGNLNRWQERLWGAPPPNLSPAETTRWLYQQYLKDYLRTATGMDENIGRVLDYLDQNRLVNDTIVIYSSDQGFFLGEHGWFDKRWMLEESLRMPLIIRYPPLIQPGTSSSAMVLNIDFAPTLLDLAGVPVPQDMQGRSICALFNGGKPADWRTSMYYRYYAREYAIPPQYGVRTERYKLIHYLGPVAVDDGTTLGKPKAWRDVDEWELFDLQTDPDERVNLHGKPGSQPLVTQLKTELNRLRKELREPE